MSKNPDNYRPEQKSTRDQESEGREWAQTYGVNLLKVYVDDDRGAWSSPARTAKASTPCAPMSAPAGAQRRRYLVLGDFPPDPR